MEETVKKTSLARRLLYIVIPLFVLSLLFFGWVIWSTVIPHPTPTVHYHAGFIVIQNNKLVKFSSSQYMSVEPCIINSNNTIHKTPSQEQIEKAHLHDNIGDVVHVENSDALWKDLFTNIHYPINYQETTAYINGNKVADFQDQKIQPDQSLVVFIGTNNNTQKFLSQAVTKQHIEQVEQKSEDCGSHG